MLGAFLEHPFFLNRYRQAPLLRERESFPSHLQKQKTISFAADITNLFSGPQGSWPVCTHKSLLTCSRFSNNTATRSPARDQTGEGSSPQVRPTPECPNSQRHRLMLTNPNLPARRLLRNHWSIETRESGPFRRLRPASCMFLSPTAVLRGLAETRSSGRTKVHHRKGAGSRLLARAPSRTGRNHRHR